MGAKYLPTNNDQKATRRFQKQQLDQSKFMKPAPVKPAVAKPAPKPAAAQPAKPAPKTKKK